MEKHKHPCVLCGACCVGYRVSFYWSEPVPEDYQETLTATASCMKGTNAVKNRRCTALMGEVGQEVACQIYENRPSPCRDFTASYYDGKTYSRRCDEARARQGLMPLFPSDWR